MKKISNTCEKLPPKLSTQGKTLEKIVQEATDVLIKDFSKGNISFRGKKVVGEYPYTNKKSYEHILKLDDKTATVPQKIERALRCAQYAELLKISSENSCCKDFKCWKEFDIKKSRWRWKVLCPKNKILIVLGEMKDSFILVTAYHLMGKGVEKELKKYELSKNKK